jgi:exosortase A-associated hydrolase 2
VPDPAAPRSEAFFAPAGQGQRFCIAYLPPPDARPRGCILYVHPFAEEMNKSRRTVAVASRALAADGWTVLQIDLAGCGDSSGDFADASWEAWLADVRLGIEWLTQRSAAPLWLWGLRAGCLVAAAALPAACRANLLLWQPVLSGKQHLNQFLRMKAAADMIGGGESTGTKALRAQLAAGEAVEVAGYMLSPSLALPLEAADLDPIPGSVGEVVWCEVQPAAAELGPASQSRIAAWRERGIRVRGATVTGLPFWQTQEIDQCDALVARTVELLCGEGA